MLESNPRSIIRGLSINILVIAFETFRSILAIVSIINLEIRFKVRGIKY